MATIHNMPKMRDLNRIFVIDQVNPETDAIASAMGYVCLLRERDGADAINMQTPPPGFRNVDGN